MGTSTTYGLQLSLVKYKAKLNAKWYRSILPPAKASIHRSLTDHSEPSEPLKGWELTYTPMPPSSTNPKMSNQFFFFFFLVWEERACIHFSSLVCVLCCAHRVPDDQLGATAQHRSELEFKRQSGRYSTPRQHAYEIRGRKSDISFGGDDCVKTHQEKFQK